MAYAQLEVGQLLKQERGAVKGFSGVGLAEVVMVREVTWKGVEELKWVGVGLGWVVWGLEMLEAQLHKRNIK